jgi:GNAT superfamily N-acetyltransferase
MNALSLQPSQFPERVRLADGSVVIVRAMRLDDVPRLRHLYHRLSPETVYRRFMVAAPKVSDRTLAYLAGVDHVDREALVATSGGQIVAVARYHHFPGTPDAEVAVVVEDSWQRRGIARILLGRLAALALQRGITDFTGSMLADNEPAKRMLLSLFPGIELRISSGESVFRASLQAASASAG